jgi:hypothetical protein
MDQGAEVAGAIDSGGLENRVVDLPHGREVEHEGQAGPLPHGYRHDHRKGRALLAEPRLGQEAEPEELKH